MSTQGVVGISGAPAVGPSAAELSTFYSPLTQIALRINKATPSRVRELATNFVLFSLVPTVIFWAWYGAKGSHGIRHPYQDLIYAMPVTSLWITFGPLLMQHGELGVGKLLSRLDATKTTGHWDVKALQKAVDRADRLYYPITVPITAAAVASVWLGRHSIGSIVDIRGLPAQLGGMVVILMVGFTTANGMWGCFKAVTMIRAATGGDPAEWLPFRPEQPTGISALHEFCWATALIFSAGSISLPTLFVVQTELPATARAIVLVFIAILGIGGLVLFTVPILWLRRLGGAQKNQVLASLAAPIEESQDAVLHADQYSADDLRRRGDVLDMALKLRREIAAQNPVPLPQLVTRGATTLALPLLLTILQLVVTSMLG